MLIKNARRRIALATAVTVVAVLVPLETVATIVTALPTNASATQAPPFTDLGVAGNTEGGPLRLLDDDSIGFSEGFVSGSGSLQRRSIRSRTSRRSPSRTTSPGPSPRAAATRS